jgi:hypothetical protein
LVTTFRFCADTFSGKITASAAPLAIALTDSQRLGISASIVFLIGGLLLLFWVRAPRGS